ncbi:MAG: DUF4446 family protein [Actinomycetota bacterium]|nr:DUF4446 family protein [Actinomycetota bacterium]
MTLSDSTLTLIALVAIGLSVLAIAFSIVGSGRRRSKAPAGPIQMSEALRSLLSGQGQRIDRLEHAVRALNATDKKQQVSIEGSVRHVTLLRFDAFEDVGGRLSFSCAMLDDRGTGVVLTSINGRQETRVYAKPVTEGTSTYNLSSEEAEAISQAMAPAPEPVKAR